MELAIMQPYFFPYIGYFQLINKVDKFLLLEDVQFIKHGWIERNRIISYNSEWSYIKVPLEKYKRETLIKDIKIKNTENWKIKLLSQLVHYKKKSIRYKEVFSLVEKSISIDTNSITELNLNILKTICEYLNIQTPIEILNLSEIKIEQPNYADEWALNICKVMKNVKSYVNPEGGQTFFNKEKYNNENIELIFIKSNLTEYNQKKEKFIKGLSIIDVLMFNSKDEVKKMIDNYKII